MNQPAAAPANRPAPPPAPHYLCFRVVDMQNSMIAGRRYTLEWTDVGAQEASRREGTTAADGRTIKITTRGQVAVSVAIAPPSGGQCRSVGQSVQSKPENKPFVATVRLTFNATATTAPQSENHCETLTLRQGRQRVKYVINNVPRVPDGGGWQDNHLKNLPYLIVDANTFEVLHAGKGLNEPAKFTGSKTQVSTVEIAVDGVASVGIVFGAVANGDWDEWRRDPANMVIYRLRPAAEGLTTVTITETTSLRLDLSIVDLLATEGNGLQRTAILNGKVWALCTRSYSVQGIRALITGNLTLPDEDGSLGAWYQVARPSRGQIDWAEQHGKINAGQAAEYRTALTLPAAVLAANAAALPSPLRMQLSWSELLEPFYSGQIVNVPLPNRAFSQGGEIIIAPLDLTLKLQVGFCDNAGRYTGLSQVEIVAKNHPYIYMMLLSACAEAGVNKVEISGMWRPMLGSCLHKLGDALDIVAVDARNDRLAEFQFNRNRVANNALARRFNTLLYEHRYANSAQHIYQFDEYPHSADGHHLNHLHITCMSRRALDPRDTAGYIGPNQQGALTPPSVFPEANGRGDERPWLTW
ncbi:MULTISPECIES: hypothetical protein [Stenotrophomonas]|uniref:hypothetical protein n=1 Tax=Stenotrophomonas TaxID=40323 RepID=UPI000AF27BB6|nr:MULTISPECIES: hypothetical protein [Stenotrophomonas]